METKTQKQKIEALKNEITAIYFNEDKRISTYAGINYLDATLELIRLQERDKTPITMIVVKELPTGEVSWDLKDYMKYIVLEEAKHFPRPEYDKCNAGHQLVEVFDEKHNRYVWDCPTCIQKMQGGDE